MPPVHIYDDLELGANEYVIKMRERVVGRGEVRPGKLLAISSQPEPPPLPGEQVREPAFGLPAWWIDEATRPLAEARGFTVVDASTVVATHFTEVVKSHAAELLSRQDVQTLIDRLREKEPAVVNELIPDLASIGTVQQVLRALLEEGVPIRDLSAILEAVADGLRRTDNLDDVVELVRAAIAPTICASVADEEGVIRVVVIDPDLESAIVASVVETAQGAVCALDEAISRELVQQMRQHMERAAAMGWEIAALASPHARKHVWRCLRRSFPNLTVLSYMEIAPGFSIEAVGEIVVSQAQMQQVPAEAA